MTIEQAFNKSAGTYDEWVRTALPNYDEIFSVAISLIPHPADAGFEVLDLGAGTGLFSQQVLQKFPNAHFVLIDLAEDMLAAAKNRFAGRQTQFEFIAEDYCSLDYVGRFDLVISSLSIHHLEHTSMQALFLRIYEALRPGGTFINVDQIKAPTVQLEEFYWQTWLEMVRSRGAGQDKIQASIQRRKIYDRDATLQDQLNWLGEAGFQLVDCVYKHHFIGVFKGDKI